jgi:5-hydroxyisourate hydrolase
MPGRLTTHVLDTMRGRPAAGLRIELFRFQGHHRELLLEAQTNADGRIDGPLLEGAEFAAGTYELEFHVGDHFRSSGVATPVFLDRVPVRFVIASPDQHYHVPLLVAPYGYTTYRGS